MMGGIMMSDVVVILGSPFHPSRTSGVVEYAVKKVEESGLSVQTINVRDVSPEDLVYANFNSQAIVEGKEAIAAAKGIIIGSPVYKASYTGLLKTYLDLLPQDAFKEKVVLPIMTGGTYAHLLTIDYALKPLLNQLGATAIQKGVYGVDSELQVNENGLEIEEGLKERIDRTIDGFATLVKR